MLTKLLKHEFKATGRLLLPIYLILFALTVLVKIVLKINNFQGVLNIIPGIFFILHIVSCIASIVITFIFAIMRFYKNLMTDEGYLMFTLPVKPSALISSKLITTMAWTIINIIAVLASVTITYSVDTFSLIEEINNILTEQFSSLSTLVIIEIIVMFLLSVVYSILIIYLSLAIGQLFNSHKLLYSVIAFISITFVLQIVLSLGAFIIGFLYSDVLFNLSAIPKLVFPGIILCNLILAVIFYQATNIIFNKKLNLE